MATISSTKIYFGKREFAFVIKCNSDGLFSAAVPPEINEMLGFSTVTGATKRDVEHAFDKALKDYAALNTTKRKVILYDIKSSAYICRDDRCLMNTTDIPFTNGAAIQIAACVFEEIAIEQPDKSVRYNYEPITSSIPKSVASNTRRELAEGNGRKANNQIEWTQAREDFFTRLGLAIENIILELQKLDSPETINEIIANKSLQFGAPKQLK
jgi:hypothetical protein